MAGRLAGWVAAASIQDGAALMQLEPPRRATTVAVGAVSNPTKPFAAIVGGSKVSSKIGVIEALLQQCDKLVMG